MHRVLLILVIVSGCKKSEPTAAPPPDKPAVVAKAVSHWVEVDPGKPLADQLAAEVAVATKAGKKPHAYLHADWCDPCVQIEKTREADPKMKAAFATTHIIAIDVDKVDQKQIEAAGMKVAVLPIFYRLDDTARATGAAIDGGAWGENVPANMAPPLAAFFAN